MTLLASIARRTGLASLPETKRDLPISLDEWASYFTFNGLAYQLGGYSETLKNGQEPIGRNFKGYVTGAYKQNGVVFACMLVRLLLFSEARFQYRQLRSGRPGDLFGSSDLRILEEPWPGGTTGDLLTRAIQDADLAGNFFCVRQATRLRRLRPDWVTIVLGSNTDPKVTADDLNAQLLGYLYQPGGPAGGKDPIALTVDEVAHFAPIPDPEAHYRGMSWLSPIINEILADKAATTHKLKFFELGATPNMIVKLAPEVTMEAAELLAATFRERHEGAANAYKTLFLGAGADLTVVGKDFQQLEFKATQGAGETRIAAAAGVPPIIVGLSEGLQAATYSNYGQARRRFADGTMRPLWRNMAGSLSRIIPVPGGAELWYDDRDIPFLQEDLKDAAEIMAVQSQAIKALSEAGYDPDTVVDAIVAGDLKRLSHTGLHSVQLQKPGMNNGKVDGPIPSPVGQ